MTNIQEIGRLKPRSRVINLLPYVLIFVPLAAKRLKRHGELSFSFDVGGTTEMSAPVSIKKSLLVDFSVTKRRLTNGP